MDFQTVLAIIGAIASIVTIIGGIYKGWQIGIKGIGEYIKSRLARAYWKVPKVTLIVLPNHERHLWWHMGGRDGKPAMQIVGDFYLTNITRGAVLVSKTFITAYYRKWGLIPLFEQVEGNVFIRNSQGDIYGTYAIPQGFTTESRADWWIQPPIKKEGEKLHGRVCFMDQFGNKHWTPILTWRYS